MTNSNVSEGMTASDNRGSRGKNAPPGEGLNDLLDLFLILRRFRVSLVLIPFIGVILVFAFSYLIPASFRSEASFIPSTLVGDQSGLNIPSGVIGAVESLGLGIGASANDPSTIYIPRLKSKAIGLEILQKKYATVGGDSLTLLEFLDQHPNPTSDEGLEKTLVYFFKKVIKINQDTRTAVTRVTITLRDPILAAGVAWQCFNSLDKSNRTVRRAQAKEFSEFLFEQLTIAKTNLSQAEYAMSEFDTKNSSVGGSPTLELQKNRLLRQLRVAENLYVSLQSQYQMAKIDETKNLATVVMIDAPAIPSKPFSPRRGVLIALSFVLLLFLGLVQALARHFFSRLKSAIAE